MRFHIYGEVGRRVQEEPIRFTHTHQFSLRLASLTSSIPQACVCVGVLTYTRVHRHPSHAPLPTCVSVSWRLASVNKSTRLYNEDFARCCQIAL